MEEKISPEEFVLRALDTLRAPDKPGLHTVFSGFNEAFREYFGGADPVQAVKDLTAKGVIKMRPAMRGAVIYPADIPDELLPKSGKKALDKMGLGGSGK